MKDEEGKEKKNNGLSFLVVGAFLLPLWCLSILSPRVFFVDFVGVACVMSGGCTRARPSFLTEPKVPRRACYLRRPGSDSRKAEEMGKEYRRLSFAFFLVAFLCAGWGGGSWGGGVWFLILIILAFCLEAVSWKKKKT